MSLFIVLSTINTVYFAIKFKLETRVVKWLLMDDKFIVTKSNFLFCPRDLFNKTFQGDN